MKGDQCQNERNLKQTKWLGNWKQERDMKGTKLSKKKKKKGKGKQVLAYLILANNLFY